MAERIEAFSEFEFEDKEIMKLGFGLGGEGVVYDEKTLAKVFNYPGKVVNRTLSDRLGDLFPKEEFSYLFN